MFKLIGLINKEDKEELMHIAKNAIVGFRSQELCNEFKKEWGNDNKRNEGKSKKAKRKNAMYR